MVISFLSSRCEQIKKKKKFNVLVGICCSKDVTIENKKRAREI